MVWKKWWNERKKRKEDMDLQEETYNDTIKKLFKAGDFNGVSVMQGVRHVEVGLARDLGLKKSEDARYVLNKANQIGSALVEVEMLGKLAEKAKNPYMQVYALDKLFASGCNYGIIAGSVAKTAGFIDENAYGSVQEGFEKLRETNFLDYLERLTGLTGTGEEKKETETKTETKKTKKMEPSLEYTQQLFEKLGADKFEDQLGSKLKLPESEIDVYQDDGNEIDIKEEHFTEPYNLELIGYFGEGDEDNKDNKLKFNLLEKRYTQPIDIDLTKEDIQPTEQDMKEVYDILNPIDNSKETDEKKEGLMVPVYNIQEYRDVMNQGKIPVMQ